MLFNYRLLARQLAASFAPRRHPNLRVGSRRARFLVGFAVCFPLMWLLSVLGMALDNLFYRGWRRTRERSPVFIVGNFRTGSSFLYRLLANDERAFTCMRTWELYFAPSVVQRKLWRGLFTADRFFGSPLLRAIRGEQERLLGKVRLHRIRLDEPEEDEALFCLTWHTLFTCFFFPDVDGDFPYHRFDRALPRSTRRSLLAFYRGCVRRHLYSHPTGAHYLAKNPSATARMASLLSEFPDARFIYLYRDPVETVPSTMRWFSFAAHYFSSAREQYPLKELIQELALEWYRYPVELARGGAAPSILFLSYEDLVASPVATVERIYAWLGIPLRREVEDRLRSEALASRGHRPDGAGDLSGTGLSEAAIEARFGAAGRACADLVREALV